MSRIIYLRRVKPMRYFVVDDQNRKYYILKDNYRYPWAVYKEVGNNRNGKLMSEERTYSKCKDFIRKYK